MALPSYDTTVMLAAIKRRAFRPVSDGLLAESDILALADEEIATAVVPMLLQIRQEFFVTYSDLTLSSTQTDYQLPTRATAESLRDVTLVDSAGGIFSIPRLEADQLDRFSNISSTGLLGFYLRDNTVVLLGTPGSYSTLRLSYFTRPNKLVNFATGAAGNTAVVASINTATKTITTTATIPTTFTTSTPMDLISYTSRFQSLAIDLTPTVAAGTTLTFAATLPTTLKVGDYIALQGYTPVAQIPVELYPYLYQRVACTILEVAGESGRLERAQKVLIEMEKKVMTAFTERVAGEVRKLVNVNGVGGVKNCRRQVW